MKIFLSAALGFVFLTQLACQKSEHVNSGRAQTTPKTPSYKIDTKKGCLVPAIVGGYKVEKDNPLKNYVVMVRTIVQSGQEKEDILCTGTLIGHNTVLTAAHCFANKNNIISSAIYASTDLYCSSGFNNSLIYKINSIIHHPNYIIDSKPNKNSPDYDLAVVKFSGILPAGYRPVSLQFLDTQSLITNPSQKFIMIGYGKTSTQSELPPELRTTTKIASNILLTKSDTTTGKAINLIQQMGLIGLTQSDGRGVCKGDSGGPLLLPLGENHILVGIASYLEGYNDYTICENGNIYYTFISTYFDWIKSHLP